MAAPELDHDPRYVGPFTTWYSMRRFFSRPSAVNRALSVRTRPLAQLPPRVNRGQTQNI